MVVIVSGVCQQVGKGVTVRGKGHGHCFRRVSADDVVQLLQINDVYTLLIRKRALSYNAAPTAVAY